MMRRWPLLIGFCLAVGVAVGFSAIADEPNKATSQAADGSETKPPRTMDSHEKEVRKLNKKEMQAKFKAMLTDVVFLGSWQMANAEGLRGKAPMSKPRSDRYVIKGVSKGLDDNWVITARVQFADRDVELPFNVRVVWAEDVPIITMDKTALPMLGTYSARVMITEGFYAGTWFGTTYGGVMQGQIVKAADEKMIEELAKKRDEIRLPPKPTTQKS
jgi:hypothetical protein